MASAADVRRNRRGARRIGEAPQGDAPASDRAQRFDGSVNGTDHSRRDSQLKILLRCSQIFVFVAARHAPRKSRGAAFDLLFIAARHWT
jgi:hypothetical protein